MTALVVESSVEFAARRRKSQDEAIAALLPLVRTYVSDPGDLTHLSDLSEALTELYVATYLAEGGDRLARTAAFLTSLSSGLAKTTENSDPNLTATWLVVATQNAASVQAGSDDPRTVVLKWTTMHDQKVREAHQAADRQRRPAGSRFSVGGEMLRYPGDPRGSLANTMNCRCVLQVVPFNQVEQALLASTKHDVIFIENRRTPKVVPEGQKYEPKPSEGKITKRRPATADEEKTIARGDWVRVNEKGKKPGEPGYMEKKSKVRPQHNALEEDTMPLETPLAWHGVLAPEGAWSGDGRRFALDSLRNRDLPLPLTWQRASGEGHDGSTVVARIDSIERVPGEDGVALMQAEGIWLDTPETDEIVGLVADFGRYGVSVDADDSEFEFDEASGKVTFTSARIASASLVSIPAFAEAWIALGTWADAAAFPPKKEDSANPEDDINDIDEDDCDPNSEDYEDCVARKKANEDTDEPGWVPVKPSASDDANAIAASQGTSVGTVEMISDAAWDGSAGRFTPEQWKASCVLHVCTGDEKSCHKLPIKEPGGALSRAGVHAAASRFNQVDAPPDAKASAARQLRGAYKQLGEEPPEVLTAALEMGRGPGWVTNPEDTRRIWAYWTQKGQPGYAKIGWGQSGDFNRCRALVGEKIAENSPEDVRFLNQICAQWHHDATGFWPGRAPSEQSLEVPEHADMAPALSFVASAEPMRPPREWFDNPNLTEPTHFTVLEDGRAFGHIAEWSTCHIGYEGVCVAPPPSASNYAHFATKRVLCADGTMVATGAISLGGGHAAPNGSMRAAVEHYDSTSTAVCDVAVGDDEHGIWAAGYVRPGTTAEQVIALRASDISGDWRDRGGDLELCAVLAVNVAGFPVVKVQDRAQVTLIAAGVVQRQDEPMNLLMREVLAVLDRRDKMARLRERVGN